MRMANNEDLDWPDYWQSLDEDGVGALASWLAAEDLQVGEFTDVVDRAYAAAPTLWRTRARYFVPQVGRPSAEAYARRKHQFFGLMAAFHEALLSGALPGDVAPHQLRPTQPSSRERRAVAILAAAIEHARRAQD
jgi:hypothetical protein